MTKTIQDISVKIRTFVYPNEEYWTNLQNMANRMAFSEQKYGPVEDAYPDKVDAIACLKERLAMYEEDGNIEWLLDVANFAVIEAMFPSHEDGHFRATDSDESPGLRER